MQFLRLHTVVDSLACFVEMHINIPESYLEEDDAHP